MERVCACVQARGVWAPNSDMRRETCAGSERRILHTQKRSNDVWRRVDVRDVFLCMPSLVLDIIVWLAQRVDLVFVFFDPHGQATCERTMNIVKELQKLKDARPKVCRVVTERTFKQR